jgi:hypothetical protein
VVSGQFLAKNKWTPDLRARLVVRIHNGEVELGPLCLSQLCGLCKVDVTRVQRLLATNGNGSGHGKRRHTETLADHLARSSATELLEAAREVGVETIWDRMISPIVSEDRAASK